MVEIVSVDDTHPLVFFFAAAAILATLIFRFYLVPMGDRERIHEHVESNGGKVIEISGVWGSGRRYERTYDVSYITASGNRMKARCQTSMSTGVLWFSDTPPDVDNAVV